MEQSERNSFQLMVARNKAFNRRSWLESEDIIQHIDNKAPFYCRKAGDNLDFAIFLRTHEITYIATYLLTMDDSAP